MKILLYIAICLYANVSTAQVLLWDTDAKGEPIQFVAIPLDQLNSILDRLDNLENREGETVIVDGITKELAEKIESDLNKNSNSTISNKYLSLIHI